MKNKTLDDFRIVLLIEAQDANDVECFYYYAVKPSYLTVFLELSKDKKVNLAKYGKIIESGIGKPPQFLKEQMAKNYLCFE